MRIQLPKKIEYVISLFQQAGFEVFAVGGCIRDSLLGRTPHDWDITTNATPEQIKEVLNNHKTIDTGIRYGTVTLVLDNENIEITTYRTECGYDDNRHPQKISFTPCLTEDLARRDFTINAMAYNHEQGIIDEFGGLADLRNRIIRTVGNSRERFHEDGLRILRGLRFAAVLDFEIAAETKEQIHQCRDLLQNISGERIYSEFTKLLLSANPTKILREFADVVCVFMPEMQPNIGLVQNHPYHAYSVYEHILKALEYTPQDKIIRYAVLFHDLGKGYTKTTDEKGVDHFRGHPAVSVRKAEIIMERLKFSNEEMEQISLLIKYHDVDIICDEYHIKRWLKRGGADFLRRLLEVQKADICGQNPQLLYRLEDIPPYFALIDKILAEAQCFQLSNLAINGNDLQELGFKPNKKLGKTLEQLLDAVMKGSLPNDKAILLNEAKKLKK